MNLVHNYFVVSVQRSSSIPALFLRGIFWAMAKTGSTRCFFGQKRMYLKTLAAESVVGRI